MLCAGLTLAIVGGSAAATTPTLMWSGAKRVNILCNVAGGPGLDHEKLTRILCRDIARIASARAPMPVRTIAIGDPAVLAGDAVTLLVHASVTSHHRSHLLAFSVRPYRPAAQQADVLFGAPPRVAEISLPGLTSPALAASLGAALSETLPWLARTPGPQRITPLNP